MTPRIRETIKVAVESTGLDKFAQVVGLSSGAIQRMLVSSDFVPMTVVSLACQLNKGAGDPNVERTSVTECIKGAMIRIPSVRTSTTVAPETSAPENPAKRTISKRQERPSPFMDPKSGRLLGFGVNTITFLVLGYFLGGFALNPILGLAPCEGLSPCVGSVLGLFISAMGSLAYTYYYFVKKV